MAPKWAVQHLPAIQFSQCNILNQRFRKKRGEIVDMYPEFTIHLALESQLSQCGLTR